MKPWHEIYRERMNDQYRNHVATKYAPFVKMLHEARAHTSVEVGCGAGNITRILREMTDPLRTRKYWMVDSCPKMLGLAIENNPDPRCHFTCADVRTVGISKFDLVHSHGLLEHFSDRDIRNIVDRIGYHSSLQVHYVPSELYKVPSRGDERLMSPKQWLEILEGLGRVRVLQFNDGLDLIIRVER